MKIGDRVRIMRAPEQHAYLNRLYGAISHTHEDLFVVEIDDGCRALDGAAYYGFRVWVEPGWLVRAQANG